MKRKIIGLIACLAFLISLTACGASSNDNAINNYEQTTGEMADGIGSDDFNLGDIKINSSKNLSGIASSNEGFSDTDTNNNVQKIIYMSNMSIETKDYDGSEDELYKLIDKFDGYVQSSNIDLHMSNNNELRYASFTIRIPSENLNQFMDSTKGIGKITSYDMDSQDITDDYYDTEARIESLEAQKKRLEDLYNKAETIDDIIIIETRLNEIIYDIESAKTRIKNYDLLVDYSTVDIYINEVAEYSNGSNTIMERLGDAWDDGINEFKLGIVEIAALAVYLVPYVLTGAAVAGAIIIIVRLAIKKHNNKKTNNSNNNITRNDK